MALSRYRGVTRPSGWKRGWIAQSRSANLWQCGFASPKQAAAWLASNLGVPLQALSRGAVRRVPTSCATSAYSCVIPHRHTRDGSRRWVVRVNGRWLGTFGSQEAGASVAARHLGVRRSSLRRKDAFSAKRAREGFRAAYQVFSGYVPGDLQHTRLQEVRCRRAFRQDLAWQRRSFTVVEVFGSFGVFGSFRTYTIASTSRNSSLRFYPMPWYCQSCIYRAVTTCY